MIDLKQPGFGTTYSFKIPVLKGKYKNNLKNRESQIYISLCNVLLQNPVVLPRF